MKKYLIICMLLLTGLGSAYAQSSDGFCCLKAIEALKGATHAPKQGLWYKYTADKFSIVEINTCHPDQTILGTDQWPLLLYVKFDCDGQLIPGAIEEATEPACANDPQGVRYVTVLKSGQTIYLYWPTFTYSGHNNDGFYFNIQATYPVDGDVCDNAIPLTLPVINLFGTTNGYTDDYDYSPCTQSQNFMDGNDKVYTITTTEEGYLTGNIIGAFGSIHVLDKCPSENLDVSHCKAFTSGSQGGQFRKKIPAGTYFVVISNNPPPQSMDFLLNLSWESVAGVDKDALTSRLNVYPNPTSDKFIIEIENADAADLSLELIATTGQIVYSRKVSSAYSFKDEISTSSLKKGVYYFKINNGKELQVKKIMVE